MSRPSWLWLDFDGVLADRVTNRSELVGEVLGLDPSICRAFYKMGYREVPRLRKLYHGVRTTKDEEAFYQAVFTELAAQHELSISADQLQGLAQRFTAVRFELLPGVETVLTLLSKDYQLGILSDALRTRRSNELQYLGLEPWFKVVLLSGEEGCDKTQTDFYSWAVTMARVPVHEQWLVDNEIPSLKMAAEVGFGGQVLVATGQADWPQVIGSLTELPKLLAA